MNAFDLTVLAPAPSASPRAGSPGGIEALEPTGFVDVLAGFVARLEHATSDGEGDADAGELLGDLEAVLADTAPLPDHAQAATGDAGLPTGEEVLAGAAGWLLRAALRFDAAGGVPAEALEEVAEEPGGVDLAGLGVALAAVNEGTQGGQHRTHADDVGAEGRVRPARGGGEGPRAESAGPVSALGLERDDADPALRRGVTGTTEHDFPEVTKPDTDRAVRLATSRTSTDEAPTTAPAPVSASEERGGARPPGTAQPAGEATGITASPPNGPGPVPEVRDSVPSRPGLAVAIERLIEASNRLEQLPPPRQLVLELGETRVRLSLDEAGLRLQVLGDQSTTDRELLREAGDELRARGFDLAGGNEQQDDGAWSGRRPAGEDAQGPPGHRVAASRVTGSAGDGQAHAASVDTALRI